MSASPVAHSAPSGSDSLAIENIRSHRVHSTWRFLIVSIALFPFLIGFLRDRKRYIKWGSPRELSDELHARRAKKLVDVFGRLGPAFIKLAQILAVREDLLPKVYAREFSRLLDQTPAADFGYVEKVIRDTTGKAVSEVFQDFNPVAIASASIGQVHRARYKSRDVVVKVRRPKVVETITLDNYILSRLLDVIHPFFGTHYLYRGFEVLFIEYKRIIAAELDFRCEADNAERIRAQQPPHPRLIIPQIVAELTSADLLVMEFCEGVRIDQVEKIREFGVDLAELVESLLEIVFSQLLVHGFFHADPHPGNILVNRRGQIILLDYGMTDELDGKTRDDFLALILAAHNNEIQEVTRKLFELEMISAEAAPETVRHVTEAILSLRHLARTNQRQVQRAVEELFEQTRILHHMRMPRQMVYLLRMGTLIEGVALRFDNDFDSIRDAVPIAKRVGLRLITRIVPFATALRYAAEVFADRVDAFLGKLTQRKKITVVRDFVRGFIRRPPAPPATPLLPPAA